MRSVGLGKTTSCALCKSTPTICKCCISDANDFMLYKSHWCKKLWSQLEAAVKITVATLGQTSWF